MTRLIDADALIDAIDQWIPSQEEFMESAIPPIENLAVSVLLTIEAQPTIDAEPVKHGKWLPMFNGEYTAGAYWFECSECGKVVAGGLQSDNRFCKKCGADMRREDDRENQ